MRETGEEGGKEGRRGLRRVERREKAGRTRGEGKVVDNIRNNVIIFSTKTISKNNTFLILLAAVPDEKGRTNCANT